MLQSKIGGVVVPIVPKAAAWVAWLQRIASVLLLFCMSGCGAAGFVVTGQLIDGDTGKPIANAWVHQEWVVSRRIAYNPNGSTARGCAAEQVARTDAAGKFRFERPQHLKESFIEYSTNAYVTPLIPGYVLDYDRSKNRGESDQVVVAKKFTGPITREGYMLGMTWFLSGGGRCTRAGESDVILSAEMSEEAARDLVKNDVTLEEFGDALLRARSKSWGRRVAPKELETDTPYIMYRRFLERAQVTK